MAKGRFLIAPFNSGQENSVRPWLIPEDAFEKLNNAYVFRGRVRKRPGTTLLNDASTLIEDPQTEQLSARLRISVDTTDGNGDSTPAATVPLTGGVPITADIGSMFSIGDDLYAVFQAAGDTYTTGGSTTNTFDTVTGAFVFAGAEPSATIYFYPSLPVMGITQYETLLINDEPTFAFDTRYAYQYASNGWLRLGTAFWNGDDAQFFWGRVWRGLDANERFLFATNFRFGSTLTDSDPIRYWDGATWTDFAPNFTSGTLTNTVLQARVIIPFKNRLVLMNIVQNTGVAPGTNIQFGNRIRFSQNGNPVAADAWFEGRGGKGGYIDAPTSEQIISAEFVRDRLIVFCERSTFELVYTGNEILPFRFQRIDDVLGVESTFSVIQFDNRLLGVGDTGIHTASSTGVQRIDDKIPDFASSISNDNNGAKRVHGIRDYFGELVYWCYANLSLTFPDKVVIYNYKNQTWAFLDDVFTTFGYFNNQGDRVWQATLQTWEELDEPWNSGTLRKGDLATIVGNHQGFVFFLEIDQLRNAPGMQITDITLPDTLTVINHGLRNGDYIAIENMSGSTLTNSDGDEITITRVTSPLSDDTFQIDGGTPIVDAYTGGGTIARVSEPEVLTKQHNFFIKEGVNFNIDKIDLYVDKTDAASLTVDSLVSSDDFAVDTQVLETFPYALYPHEVFRTRLWHSIYPSADGEVVQFKYYMNDAQMRDTRSAWAAFTIHAFLYYASPTSDRLE